MDSGNKYCINMLLLNDCSSLGNGMGAVFPYLL